MGLIKNSGLLLGGFTKLKGEDYNNEFSMLIEQLLEGQDSFKLRLKNIEEMLKAIILGHIDAAKFSLNNSSSPSLTPAERKAEILDALRSLQLCYGQLMNVKALEQYKPEVAFMMGICNVLLKRNDIALEWFEKSHEDFEKILALSPSYNDDLEHNLGAFIGLQASASIGIGGALLGLVGAVTMAPVAILALGAAGVTGVCYFANKGRSCGGE